MANQKKDDIDYTAEGNNPGNIAASDTDQGYDEAAHHGSSRYGTPEGEGGVFGTTGGGSYGGGFQIVERPLVYESGDEPKEDHEES